MKNFYLFLKKALYCLFFMAFLSPLAAQVTLNGKVTDTKGEPLIAVSVHVKGSKILKITDDEGRYTMSIPANISSPVVVFSYVGFKSQEVVVGSRTVINVIMEEEAVALEEVVITGMFTRKKESFTGTVKTSTNEDLRSVANQNVLQSLKTLDPSFIVVDNTLSGSNPNAKMNVEIRGATSININDVNDQFAQNPNQPLFIIDGFEATIEQVTDLDMNRVESVTLLKDAASTAIYGSKSANGVVVIETIKPKQGELRIFYTGDFRLDVPDLSEYNLMNASEKLEFERLSGRYTNDRDAMQQMKLTALYNQKLAEVRRGVDTYWLSESLRLGYSIGTSLQITGGSEEFVYGIGFSYKPQQGVMKGSYRKPWGANVDLTYRKGKINVTNRLNLSGYTASESYYGSFSQYAKTNQYYRKNTTDKYLEESPGVEVGSVPYLVPNPLYNASLHNTDGTSSFGFTDNLKLIWSINNQFRFDAAMQLKKDQVENIVFVSPEDTSFDGVSIYTRGRYRNARTDQFGYTVNAALTYVNMWADKHSLTANLRAEIQETENKLLNMVAVGFPPGTNGNPAFAMSYEPDARPAAAKAVRRQINTIASLNYSYDSRYLLDASFRYDGTSVFGSTKRFSPFYSVGIGWNIHNEKFMQNAGWLNMLKLRANTGSTGNQNIGMALSTNIYSYFNGINYFGQGLILSDLGNPNIQWQRSLQTDISLDIGVLHGLLNASFSVYSKNSSPLSVAVTTRTSTGRSTMQESAGSLLTQGVEGMVSVSPIRLNTSESISRRIVWTINVSATAYRSEYSGFGNLMDQMNAQQYQNNSLERLQDGYSPTDIWAVRSLGIDPATGQEVFLKKDGTQTFVYDPADIVKVGNTRPAIEGIIGTNFTFKGLTVGVNLRYRYGGQLFNTTLFEKVENISLESLKYNQDKRAFYDRWQKPGDVASFKAINITTNENTRPSSRFVQADNTLIGESLNIGWTFDADSWIRHLKLQTLKFALYGNDLFRFSTTETERGIDYPYARSFSLSVSASF